MKDFEARQKQWVNEEDEWVNKEERDNEEEERVNEEWLDKENWGKEKEREQEDSVSRPLGYYPPCHLAAYGIPAS